MQEATAASSTSLTWQRPAFCLAGIRSMTPPLILCILLCFTHISWIFFKYKLFLQSQWIWVRQSWFLYNAGSNGSVFNLINVTTTSVLFGWDTLDDATVDTVCIQPADGNKTCQENVTQQYAEFSGLVAGAPYTLFIEWDSGCDVSRTINIGMFPQKFSFFSKILHILFQNI